MACWQIMCKFLYSLQKCNLYFLIRKDVRLSYELQGQKAQSMELYTQANNLSPTDPAILFKLAKLYDAEGDKTQAFQCHLDVFMGLSIFQLCQLSFIELQIFSFKYRSD